MVEDFRDKASETKSVFQTAQLEDCKTAQIFALVRRNIVN